MSTMYETCALQFPSSYVLMDTKEMEYLEGGNGWYNSRGFIAGVIDVAITVITAGVALNSLASLKAFLKANKNKILYQVRGKIVSFFGTAVGTILTAGVEVALTAAGTSIGGLAYGIDYVDGNRLNGYCFG